MLTRLLWTSLSPRWVPRYVNDLITDSPKFLSGVILEWIQFADVNECENPDKCTKEAQCVNVPGGYVCQCPPRYTGDGKSHGLGCISVFGNTAIVAEGNILLTFFRSIIQLFNWNKQYMFYFDLMFSIKSCRCHSMYNLHCFSWSWNMVTQRSSYSISNQP